jgi:hypothetical protein
MRAIALPLFLTILSGCTATYQQSPVTEAGLKLLPGKAIAVSTPENGAYDGKAYSQSGQMTAQAVRAAFAQFAGDVHVLPECKSLECLRQSAPAGVAYFVVPEILHWEDRATEWSGIKDKLEIRLAIFGPQGDSPIASTIISGKSKWMTFGGDHPQDLMPGPINAYVASVYAGKSRSDTTNADESGKRGNP